MIKSFTHTLVFILTLSLFSSCVNNTSSKSANTSGDIFKEYQAQGMGRVISVPPAMVAIFLDETVPSTAKLKDLLNDTKKLLFLIIPLDSASKEEELHRDINSQLRKIKFHNLASIDNGSEMIDVKVLCSDDKNISEMVVIVSNHKTLFCISFQGDIQYEKVISLTKPENIDIITNLNRFSR